MRPIRSSLRARVILLAAAALAASCASVKPSEDASHLSPIAQNCAREPGASGCEDALFEAAAAGSRREAGQLLLALASTAPDGAEQDTLTAAALWLEPAPWLPAEGPITLGDIKSEASRTGEVKSGAILLFKGAKISDRNKHKVRFALDYKPTMMHPATLAALLASASGADAAVFAAGGEEVRVVPASARTIAALSIPPQLGVKNLDLARSLSGADRAWRDGRHLDAIARIDDARDALGEVDAASAKACRTHGVLSASAAIIASLSHGDSGERRGHVRDACVGERGSLDPLAAYLGALSLLETRGMDSADYSTTWAPRVDSAKSAWTARQRALVETLQTRHAFWNDSAASSCEVESIKERADALAARSRDLHDTLRALGREDLALSEEAKEMILPEDPGAPINGEGARRWLSNQRLPERQWLGVEALGVAVDLITPTSTSLDRAALGAACDLYQRQLEGLLRADKSDKSPWRTSERMISGATRLARCPMSEAHVQEIVRAALEGSAAHPNGSAAIAEFIAATFATSIARVLSGETATIYGVANALITELEKVRTLLGDSLDDRTLAALLDALSGSIRSMANPALTQSVLLTQVKKLDAIIADEESSKSKMSRSAPIIRFSLLIAATAHGTMLGQRESALTALSTLEKNLDKDLAAMLAATEQPPEIAPTLKHHVLAITAMVRGALFGQSVDLEAALSKTNTEALPAGWWRVAGHVSAAAIRGGAIAIYHQLGAKKDIITHKAALRAQLDAMAKDILTDFELRGSGWELLNLLGTIVDQGIDAIAASDDADLSAILAAALPELEARAKEILAKANAQDKASAAPDLVSLMLEVVRATLEVGLENLWENDEVPSEARVALANELAKNADTFPATMRVFIDSMRAILLSKPDQAASIKALGSAQEFASMGDRQLEPLPLAVGLFLDREGQRSPKETLALLSELGIDDPERATCERRALARSLLPFRANLLALNGARDDAAKVRRDYLARINAQQLMDARIELKANAQRGHLAATLDLSYPASRLLSARQDLPEGADSQGTFQIGLGYSSLTAYRQSLTCKVRELPQTNAELLMEVSTDLLVDSLIHAPNEVASADMQRVIFTLSTLDPARNNEPVDLSALPWIVQLATARGFWLQALTLRGVITTNLADSGSNEAFGRQEGRYPGYASLIKAGHKGDKPQIEKSWPDDAPRTLSADLMYAGGLALGGKKELAWEELTKLSMVPVQAHTLPRDTIDLATLEAFTRDLRSSKFDAEACELVRNAITSSGISDKKDFVLTFWRSLDPAQLPACHLALSQTLYFALKASPAAGDAALRSELREVLLETPHIKQRIPALLLEQARDQLELGKLEQMRPLVREFCSTILTRPETTSTPQLHIYLATMEMTSRIASGDFPDTITTATLLEMARANAETGPELEEWIAKVHATQDDRAALVPQAQQLLLLFMQ